MNNLIAVFVALLSLAMSVASAQLDSPRVRREWEVRLPRPVQSLTVSRDCQRYAYVSQGLLVRCNAVTGAQLAIASVSDSEPIIYCGRKLYFLHTSSRGDSTILSYFDGDSAVSTRTRVAFVSSDSLRYSTIRFVPLGGNVLALQVAYQRSIPETGEKLPQTTEWCIVDTTHMLITMRLQRPIQTVSVAADGKSFVSDEKKTQSYSTVHSLAYATLPDIADVTQFNMWGSSDDVVAHIGFPSMIYVDGTTHDAATGAQYRCDLPTNITLVCNAASGGWMLGSIGQNESRIVLHDIVHRISYVIDSVPGSQGYQSAQMGYAIEEHNTLFHYDASTGLFRRYHVEYLPIRPLKQLFAVVVEQSNYAVLYARLHMYESRRPYYVKWIINGAERSNTDQYSAQLLVELTDATHIRVEMFDAMHNLITSIDTTIAARRQRPDYITSILRTWHGPVEGICLSPSAQHVAVQSNNSTAIFRRSDAVTNASAAIKYLSGHPAFVFHGSDDDFVTMKCEYDGMRVLQSLQRGSMLGLSTLYLHSMETAQSELHTLFQGKLAYNRATSRWLWTLRDSGPEQYSNVSGGLTSMPMNMGMVSHIIPTRGHVVDFDAEYGSSVVITFERSIRIFDLVSQTTEADLSSDFIQPFHSSLMVDRARLVTDRGIYHVTPSIYGGTWALRSRFPFDDGLQVVRLPNPDYVFVLRRNQFTMGHVVMTSTGDVVHTVGAGFGVPTCAVYDSVGKVVLIGDYTGLVIGCTIPLAYAQSTNVQTRNTFSVSPCPARDEVTLNGLPECLGATGSVKVTDMTGRSFELYPLAGGKIDVTHWSPGLYSLSVSCHEGTWYGTLIRE